MEQVKPGQHARRVKCVVISAEMLLEILKTSGPRVISCEGVPEDAKALRIAMDGEWNRLLVFYEHETFPWVELGSLPDQIWPTFATYHGDAALKALATHPENLKF